MDTRIIKKITGVGFIIIILGLFYYQIIKGTYFFRRAQANYIKIIPQEAIRGSILDRNFYSLAFDSPIFNIAVVPYQIESRREKLFTEISDFLGISKEIITRNYKTNIESLFSPVDIVKDIDKEKALQLKEIFGENIFIKEVPQRFYPYAYEFSHVLGYVKMASIFYEELKTYGYTPFERVGFLGVEQYYNSYLKGIDGGKLLEVNSVGEIVGFLGKKAAQTGKDIVLTVDSNMQHIAYETLGERRGSIILMNPHNGEIVVLCSRPSYNVNDFIKGINVGQILRSSSKMVMNRTIQLSYPLGSVFKPIVAIAGLEERAVRPDVSIDCRGSFFLGKSKFGCWDIHNKQSLPEAIIHSCNVYFYNLGLKLGIEKLSRWARRFGLGRFTGVDLPYERSGIVPDDNWKLKSKKSRWFKGDTVNVSIGQGYLEATPLQAIVAMSVFANGGYIVRPHLLSKVEDMETAIVRKNYLNISDNSLRLVNRALRDVVGASDGTANVLASLGLDIAGKTGTAQNPSRSHGWFVGFFPYHSPKYSVCVFLENAGSSLEALKVTYRFLKKLKEENLVDY